MHILRRKFLINKQFQIRFILFALIPNLLCITMLFIAQELFFQRILNVGKKLHLDLGFPYLILLRHQIEGMRVVFIVFAVVLTIIFLGWGLLMSHKIAGPLFRFTNTLKNVPTDGKLQKFNFRPKDFFQELPEAYNEFLKRRSLLDEKKDQTP